ncbi:hypothetical protein G7Y89_g1414 [Cudoniella acicularis]|uniref:STAS domain-containing protein n=1 Tax=Cudoniella acicularis TaxID=354080 RepID=A0A8H4RVB8_9HELO|nr:hypothetical protein G7Y89_g1414 [Cudoniella acicularis]
MSFEFEQRITITSGLESFPLDSEFGASELEKVKLSQSSTLVLDRHFACYAAESLPPKTHILNPSIFIMCSNEPNDISLAFGLFHPANIYDPGVLSRHIEIQYEPWTHIACPWSEFTNTLAQTDTVVIAFDASFHIKSEVFVKTKIGVHVGRDSKYNVSSRMPLELLNVKRNDRHVVALVAGSKLLSVRSGEAPGFGWFLAHHVHDRLRAKPLLFDASDSDPDPDPDDAELPFTVTNIMSARRTTSPGSSHSRHPSIIQHAPTTPSTLREAHTIADSPEEPRDPNVPGVDMAPSSSNASPNTYPTHLDADPAADDDDDATDGKTWGISNLGGRAISESTSLLRKPFEFVTGSPHGGPCNHGTFSPRLESRADSVRSGYSDGFGGSPPRSARESGGGSSTMFGSLLENIGMKSGSGNGKKKMSTTSYLAEQHGITNTTTMYLAYYVPFFAWIRQYRWVHFQGDLVAALTVASFYIPMALSYASNLAHVPPINGLYSFVFNPVIYAILGSCPQMVVGPEAAGSLLVGSVVRSSIDNHQAPEFDDVVHARVAGVVTGMAGAVIFIAGLTRLGFLDSVLSRPFLRGFISAIGFVIFVDQLIPEMGLADWAEEVGGISHGSSIDKIRFLLSSGAKASGITCAVSGASFMVIMVFRELKRHLQPHYPNVAYIPDRFFVVVISVILSWQLRWDEYGLDILGEVKSSSGNAFPFHWPFQLDHMVHVREAMGTSFLIALLGFFESSVAAKSLGGGEGKDGIQGIALSPNRELVALGVANLVGGCFSALPAFGGYGRSKVNASTGGKTPMSSIFLSIITVICILYLLPAFYYLPKAVLSSMISVVAWSLIEEAPHDILFFLRIRGYTELGLMVIIFAATIFYSLTLGIAIGVGLSLLSVIKHSTRPRIQILGRIPGTNRFENAEDNPDKLEFIEGCLIVKIPEPLTFANTGDLKNRLRRLELYGTTSAHPALPRVRSPEHNKNVIFDIHGVTGLDGSGTQVLEEIVRNYRDRGVRVFFSRGPVEGSPIYELFRRSGILDIVGGKDHFVADVGEALRLTEVEEGDQVGYENLAGDEGGG